MRCQIRPSPVGKALGCGCSGCVPADSSNLQRVLPSSCRKQHRHTQQPACRAPPLHQQGACGFQNPSVLTRRRSATPQDFIFPPPPPPQASKSVTHQFQTVTFHSQPILGAAGFVTHGDAGRREGRARLNEAKAARSLPHAGMSLLHFRSTQFGTCWRIPLQENNTVSTSQRKISVQAVMQSAVSQEGLLSTSHRHEEAHCPRSSPAEPRRSGLLLQADCL